MGCADRKLDAHIDTFDAAYHELAQRILAA